MKASGATDGNQGAGLYRMKKTKKRDNNYGIKDGWAAAGKDREVKIFSEQMV